MFDHHCCKQSTNEKKQFFLKQRQLGQTQRRFQQRIQEREKELQELRKAVETLKVRTDHIRQQLAQQSLVIVLSPLCCHLYMIQTITERHGLAGFTLGHLIKKSQSHQSEFAPSLTSVCLLSPSSLCVS